MCVNIYVRERLTEDWFQMPSGRSIPGGLDHGPSFLALAQPAKR